jgi:hypothetical protein
MIQETTATFLADHELQHLFQEWALLTPPSLLTLSIYVTQTLLHLSSLGHLLTYLLSPTCFK